MIKHNTTLVQCANCHGAGGYGDNIDWEICGYCRGIGQTSRQMNCWIMRWNKDSNYAPSSISEKAHEDALKAAGVIVENDTLD